MLHKRQETFSGSVRGFTGCCRFSALWRRLAFLLIVVLVLTIVTPQPSLVQAQESQTVHIVSWGETLYSIASRYNVSVEDVIAANNLTTDRIYAGQQLIIPGGQQPSTASGVHVVQPGETLFRIALAYGIQSSQLAAANNITDPTKLYAGQQLIIPSGDLSAQPVSGTAATGSHIVQRGETLSQIARRYSISVSSLLAANDIANPSMIYAGQQLSIPGGAAVNAGYTPDTAGTTHIVAAGETLSSIAARYQVSSWTLAQINNLANPSVIFAGQSLAIPANGALTSGTQPPASSKAVVVDVSDQRTYVYENGQLKWTFIVSTGMPGSGTRRGNFRIQNKIPNAYASTWDLQMPYWLGFYWAGPLQNGFHALPILSNGNRLWAGLLGRPASYGCVILSENDARLLYNWVDIGTPVTVRD